MVAVRVGPHFILVCALGAQSLEPVAADAKEWIFSKYKPNSNYFLLYDEPVKFEISVKSKLYAEVHEREGEESYEHIQAFFGYTQVSLWDLYKLSAPFLESNYEPELFGRYNLEATKHWIQFGLVHQSNGKGDSTSRSWNRVYLQPKIQLNPTTDLYLKVWTPVFNDLDDNPDILRYLGYGELILITKYRARIEGIIDYLADGTLELRARKSASDDWSHGSLQLGLSWGPFHSRSEKLRDGSAFFLALYANFFVGYGETLISYNVPVRKFRVGVSFGFE